MDEPTYVSNIATVKALCTNQAPRHHFFLKFFLSRIKDKMYVHGLDIDLYDDEILGWDHMSVALREEVIAKIRGYARPYDDGNHDDDDRDPALKITERNYATVQALIVNNPQDYRGRIGNGFPDTQIMTPEEFMFSIEASPQHQVLVLEFKTLWETRTAGQR